MGCLLGVVAFVIAFCAGIIRPPRPMFSDSYAAGGFGIVPMWQPNTPIQDQHGHWLWVDEGGNVIAIQATGTGKLGRSHAMAGGLAFARFRVGDAEVDEKNDRYVTVPRTRDALIVILPDGRWRTFPSNGQALPFFRACVEMERLPNLLSEVVTLLDGETKGQFEEFIRGYSPP